jgi:hypothetical protein
VGEGKRVRNAERFLVRYRANGQLLPTWQKKAAFGGVSHLTIWQWRRVVPGFAERLAAIDADFRKMAIGEGKEIPRARPTVVHPRKRRGLSYRQNAFLDVLYEMDDRVEAMRHAGVTTEDLEVWIGTHKTFGEHYLEWVRLGVMKAEDAIRREAAGSAKVAGQYVEMVRPFLGKLGPFALGRGVTVPSTLPEEEDGPPGGEGGSSDLSKFFSRPEGGEVN